MVIATLLAVAPITPGLGGEKDVWKRAEMAIWRWRDGPAVTFARDNPLADWANGTRWTVIAPENAGRAVEALLPALESHGVKVKTAFIPLPMGADRDDAKDEAAGDRPAEGKDAGAEEGRAAEPTGGKAAKERPRKLKKTIRILPAPQKDAAKAAPDRPVRPAGSGGEALPTATHVDPVIQPAWRDFNCILLGNLVDNPAIGWLYDRYLTYVDAAYPGPGGYVIHRIRRPAGRSTWWVVGASEPYGLEEGARLLAGQLAELRRDRKEIPLLSVRLGGDASIRIGASRDADGAVPLSRAHLVESILENARMYLLTGSQERAARALTHLENLVEQAISGPHPPAFILTPESIEGFIRALRWMEPLFNERHRFVVENILYHTIARSRGEYWFRSGPENLGGHRSVAGTFGVWTGIESLLRSEGLKPKASSDLRRWKAECEGYLDALTETTIPTETADLDGFRAAMVVFRYALARPRPEFFPVRAKAVVRRAFASVDPMGYLSGTSARQGSMDSPDLDGIGGTLARIAAYRTAGTDRSSLRWLSEQFPRFRSRDPGPGGTDLHGWAETWEVRWPPPKDWLGITIIPADQRRYDHLRGRAPGDRVPPAERCFDRAAFRGAFSPDAAYLLLGGCAVPAGEPRSTGTNAILRFTACGELWLGASPGCRTSFDQNSVHIGLPSGGSPPPLAELVHHQEDSRTACLVSRLSEYSGTDWHRSIVGVKTGDGRDWFLAIDRIELEADSPRTVTASWHSPHPSAWDGVRWRSHSGNHRFTLIPAGGERTAARREEPGERSWSLRQFQRLNRRGERAVFAGLFHACALGEPERFCLRRSPEGIWLVGDGKEGTQDPVVAILDDPQAGLWIVRSGGIMAGTASSGDGSKQTRPVPLMLRDAASSPQGWLGVKWRSARPEHLSASPGHGDVPRRGSEKPGRAGDIDVPPLEGAPPRAVTEAWMMGQEEIFPTEILTNKLPASGSVSSLANRSEPEIHTGGEVRWKGEPPLLTIRFPGPRPVARLDLVEGILPGSPSPSVTVSESDVSLEVRVDPGGPWVPLTVRAEQRIETRISRDGSPFSVYLLSLDLTRATQEKPGRTRSPRPPVAEVRVKPNWTLRQIRCLGARRVPPRIAGVMDLKEHGWKDTVPRGLIWTDQGEWAIIDRNLVRSAGAILEAPIRAIEIIRDGDDRRIAVATGDCRLAVCRADGAIVSAHDLPRVPESIAPVHDLGGGLRDIAVGIRGGVARVAGDGSQGTTSGAIASRSLLLVSMPIDTNGDGLTDLLLRRPWGGLWVTNAYLNLPERQSPWATTGVPARARAVVILPTRRPGPAAIDGRPPSSVHALDIAEEGAALLRITAPRENANGGDLRGGREAGDSPGGSGSGGPEERDTGEDAPGILRVWRHSSSLVDAFATIGGAPPDLTLFLARRDGIVERIDGSGRLEAFAHTGRAIRSLAAVEARGQLWIFAETAAGTMILDGNLRGVGIARDLRGSVASWGPDLLVLGPDARLRIYPAEGLLPDRQAGPQGGKQAGAVERAGATKGSTRSR